MAAADFLGVYHYQDAYVAMEYQGVPMVEDNVFDDNSYLEMRLTQKIELVYMFSRDTRRLAFSRMMRKPMQ